VLYIFCNIRRKNVLVFYIYMLLLYYSIIGLCTYEYGVTTSLCRGVLLYTVWLCLLLCAIDNIPTVCSVVPFNPTLYS
jgi:hypothetical protein